MKANILLLLFLCLGFSTKAQAEKQSLPSDSELAAIHDSICSEAYILYDFEKCAWNSGDSFTENCKSKIKKKVDGVMTYALSEKALTTIYFNTEEWKCYYQYIQNGQDSTVVISEPRDIEPNEFSLFNLILRARTQIAQMNVLPTNSALGPLNMDVIPMSENLIRIYFVQGANRRYVIPFGNDFCFDFDGQGNLITWRKFHSGLIASEWEKGNPPTMLMHSHLEMSPYITTTDICTFMLYGYGLYGLKSFKVYSKVFGQCFEFNAEKFEIKCVPLM